MILVELEDIGKDILFFKKIDADMIGIGNHDALYYCFPEKGVSVAKTRMAVEELYKMKKAQ